MALKNRHFCKNTEIYNASRESARGRRKSYEIRKTYVAILEQIQYPIRLSHVDSKFPCLSL